jgi:hypothetical protein
MPLESVITAFASGELSPSVYGRTDLQQYAQGAAALDNMIVLPSGSARKRPGTEYIRTLDKGPTVGRLFRFQVSDSEDYVVTVTSTHIKVHDKDGVLKNSTIFALANTEEKLKSIRVVQAKYDMVLVSRHFAPQLLAYNKAADTFSLAAIDLSPPNGVGITFANTTDNCPGAVTIVDERLVFGGTNNEPNGLFGSAIKALDNYANGFDWALVNDSISYNGDAALAVKAGEFYPTNYAGAKASPESDMNFFANRAGTTDSAPWAFGVLDNGAIDIRWITSTNTLQNGFVVLGSRAGLYAIVGGAGGSISAASPLNAVRMQSSAGCSSVQGIIVNNYLLYVDSSRRRIRVATFNLQTDQYDTTRMTDLADHLFDSDIKEIHYQRSPLSLVWVVLENGNALCFSYDSTGALSAWSPMDFGNSSVVSMSIIQGEDEDTPTFLMYNSDQEEYTIEALTKFNVDDQEEYWFVDAGVRQYNATAFTVVTGLTHLEGETVKVWADGAAHKDRVVESGEIELTREVNTAIVGRQYTGTVTTLPIQQEQDKIKRVSKVFVRFLKTLGAKAGDEEFEEIVPFMEGDFEMGSIPTPFSGIKEIPYMGRHGEDAQVTVFSDSATPFHVLSLITRLEIYG